MLDFRKRISGGVKWVAGLLSATNENQIPAFSANAAFFIIIAIFPALMVLLMVLPYTPLTTEDLVEAMTNLLPSSLTDFAESLINDMYTRASGTILSVAVIATVWSASRGVLGVLTGLNAVYGIKDDRNSVLKRLISMVYMLGVLIAILLSLGLHVFSSWLSEFITGTFPWLKNAATFIVSFKSLITVVVLSALFCLIYMVFPNRRASFFSQLPGAVVASLGWLLFSYFFGVYVDNYANYSFVYGSLATIVIAMLWLYICMMILFMGGAINAYSEATENK